MSSGVNLNQAISECSSLYGKYLLDGKVIYTKVFSLIELLAEEISNFLGLNPVHYQIGTYGGLEMLFCEQFYQVSQEKYISGRELLSEYYHFLKTIRPVASPTYSLAMNNLTDIEGALAYKYRQNKNIPEVMKELCKLFSFDIITSNSDRHDQNWGIIEAGESLCHSVFYDNGNCFNFTTYSLGFEYGEDENLQLLSRFFELAPTEFVNLFTSMYDKLSLSQLQILIKRVEESRSFKFSPITKEEIIAGFDVHRREIAKFVPNGLGRGL